jgi:hypothetical protein
MIYFQVFVECFCLALLSFLCHLDVTASIESISSYYGFLATFIVWVLTIVLVGKVHSSKKQKEKNENSPQN